MTDSIPRKALHYRRFIFSILCAGYVLVFFHRLCPAVVAVDMMRDLNSGGTLLGILSSAYFYPYALMQIPTGLLSDSWGPRRTISLFLLIAAAGSLLLGMAPSTTWAFGGRVLVGLGVSTLFVATLKMLSRWFHSWEFASMTGVLMAMGGVGSLCATGPLAFLSAAAGWRLSFVIVGGFTLLVAVLAWVFVRDTPADLGWTFPERTEIRTRPAIPLREGVRMVLAQPAFRPVALWFFFNCAVFFSFAGLWGGPYLMHVHGVGKAAAGQILSLAAIGLIIGSPLMSYLSNRVLRGRKPVLVLSSLLVLVLTLPLAFISQKLPLPLVLLICFGLGATAGAAVVVAFTMVKELYPVQISGTATGLANIFPFAGAALFQPFLGAVLERYGKTGGGFTPEGYQAAFFVLFLCGTLALISALRMRETMGKPAIQGE
jgi:sugar phosphate permease